MLCTPPAQRLDPYSQDQDINASESANPKTLFNIWISGEALSFEGAYRWGSFRYFHPSNPVLVLLAFEDHLGNGGPCLKKTRAQSQPSYWQSCPYFWRRKKVIMLFHHELNFKSEDNSTILESNIFPSSSFLRLPSALPQNLFHAGTFGECDGEGGGCAVGLLSGGALYQLVCHDCSPAESLEF